MNENNQENLVVEENEEVQINFSNNSSDESLNGEDIQDLDLESEGEGEEEGDNLLDIELNESVLEALLFANGEPISFSKLKEVLGVEENQLYYWIEELKNKYKSDEYSFELVEFNNEYQLRTKDIYAGFIRKLKLQRPRRLSASALETLSVIAYRQPIIKSDIERIKGVDATATINTLMSRNLVKIIGNADKIGQPALYATTDEFLRVFGLNSLKDLPNLRDITSLSEEPKETQDEE